MIYAAIVAVVAIVASFILANRRQKSPDNPNQQFDESSLPIASEGETICSLFGTREIKKSNVVGVGGYWSETKEL